MKVSDVITPNVRHFVARFRQEVWKDWPYRRMGEGGGQRQNYEVNVWAPGTGSGEPLVRKRTKLKAGDRSEEGAG